MSKLKSVADGDSRQRAFEEFIRPHFDALYRRAYHLTGTVQDAEDLVQELCIRVFPRLDGAQTIENPKAWLMRVLYHLFVVGARRIARAPLQVIGSEDDRDSARRGRACARPVADDDADDILTHGPLRRALKLLRPDERALLVFHEVEACSLSELESITDLPASTVKSKLQRARIRLGRFLLAGEEQANGDPGGTRHGLSEIRHSVG